MCLISDGTSSVVAARLIIKEGACDRLDDLPFAGRARSVRAVLGSANWSTVAIFGDLMTE
jgi:hypothetical protein